MEKPQRKPNRIAGYDYSQSGAYFVTICTQDRKKILSRISVGTPLPGCPQIPHDENGHPGTGVPTVELLWHGEIANQYIRQMDAFYEYLSVDQYMIMPDHIHLLITIHDGHPERCVTTRTSEIARFVGTFKRFSTKNTAAIFGKADIMTMWYETSRITMKYGNTSKITQLNGQSPRI